MRFATPSALVGLLAALAAVVDASPTMQQRQRQTPARRSRHVLHERRSEGASNLWARTAKADPAAVLPVRIGLKQQNLERGEEFLLDVSHPTSANYGRHWTAEQVAKMFAPRPETVDAVLDWLADTVGIGEASSRRVELSRGRNWVMFNATVEEVERLLATEYHVYRHTKHGHEQVACDQYHVPEHLREHIDLVLPTVHFGRSGPGGRSGKTHQLPEDVQTQLRKREGSGEHSLPGQPSDASLAKQGAVITNALMSLDQCDSMITPACLRALYAAPVSRLAAANNSIGIVEYTPQAILQSDLDQYFSQFAPQLTRGSAARPVVRLIDNAVLQTDNESFSFNGESALDLEFAMTLVAPQTATLFQVGDLQQGASFNNLLDSLDGSYCTFEGGGSSDSSIDGQYDNSVNCGTATPTNVLSTSYSYNEADLTAAYEQRQCAEYMKLGLRGVSVLYSSGDYGVAGNSGQCIDATTGVYNDGTDGLFTPSFPGTCPYVTSVGATQLPVGSSVPGPEIACQKVIYSGGGFSNVFAMPSYQKAAVNTYYTAFAPAYGADRYNNSRAVRGYPDVSANGANYVTAVDGNFTLSFGTSASAPTFASILNLINEKRLAAGKTVIGFVNPVLYANPQVLNDIISGSNPGCGTDGFTAVSGWDPLTGLGTPNYTAMEKLFLSLP
ncbi:protease s8 tripeptidyl peptidase [Grosmannia clavigera kw1407]|uniref:tripeptidyl-peptidase II n=1 Tax=Grosmannia clavigera (strain kw1407 / UAMH 11150) TaxID=655863 RepID=F0XJ32_GROCL|nr:protease s8 tripeptidyl peptidase [Grosmannia clavigera kw1407]EFX02100.1 protease s8 tripeptidyl peptidase [Grosmannia clavigera kw1407]